MTRTWPAIDHTLLSPSGRASKRARRAALEREAKRLFPPGYFDSTSKSDLELAQERVVTLRKSAQNLRDLAYRGMSPRKYNKAANNLEAQASQIEKEMAS